MRTTTYVQSVEAFQSVSGRVTFVRVEFATGHRFTCQPEEAPKVGDWFDLDWNPCEHSSMLRAIVDVADEPYEVRSL